MSFKTFAHHERELCHPSFPLAIYLLSGWLSQRFPGVDFQSHDAGHLLEVVLGSKGDPHFGAFHILSNILIGSGFWLLASAWTCALHDARSRTHGWNLVTFMRSTRRIRRHSFRALV
jgi:hypothetical protein